MASYNDWAARARVPLHFLLAALVAAFARPTVPLLAGGAALVAAGVLARAWAAGHLRRELPLTTSGPYAYVRHPLYLGSALIVAGFAVASARLWLAAVCVAYYLLLFVPVILREEAERRALEPEGYADYARRVPALVPYRGRAAAGGGARFDWAVWRKNREWRGEVGCALLLLLLTARLLWG